MVLLRLFQRNVRRLHDPLRKLRLQPGQPRPLREQPVTGREMGGASEGPGPGAAVWGVQGGPGSHEVAAALLQVGSDGHVTFKHLLSLSFC